MTKGGGQVENRGWVEQVIHDFWASPQNILKMPCDEPAWGKPLIGIARGD